MSRSRLLLCVLALLGSIAPSCAMAQLPAARLDGVFPAGALPGSSVDVTVSGNDLDDVDRLVFNHDGITFVRKMADATPFDDGPQPVENVFTVSVAPNVPAGDYEIRCHGKYGLSNRRTFVVGSLPEVTEVEPNGGPELPAWITTESDRTNPALEVTLPVIINGQSTGGPDVDWYRFNGSAGQRVLLDAHCRRIESRMDLTSTLYTESGTIVAESRRGDAGDAFIDCTLPQSGLYFVKVHDVLYGQGPGYVYRLAISAAPHLDFVFPPSGAPGSNDEYTVYGRSLPGGQPSPFVADSQSLEQLTTRISIPGDIVGRLASTAFIPPHLAGLDAIEHRVTNNGLMSNPLLLVPSTAPQIREAANDSKDAPQALTLPCEVVGQFYPQRDADWYTFEAKKGDEWVIAVDSHRLGAATDPSLLIQRLRVDDKGQPQVDDVAFVDDPPDQNFNNRSGRHEFDERTTDPSYKFRAPEDGTYRLMLKDAASAVRSDPRLVYRLAIRKAVPDFRIVAVPNGSTEALMLRKSGRDVVRLVVYRQDFFDGEIRVSASGLPTGVTTEEIVIGPGNHYGTLVLTASDSASGTSTLDVVARATINGTEVVRPARYGAAFVPFQFNQPLSILGSVPARLVPRIQVCVSETETAPQTLTIGNGTVLETSRGGVLKIPYTVRNSEGIGGNLLGFLNDFPPNSSAQQVNIGGNTSGEFELRFQANSIPGTYSVHLAGFNQGLQYKRNPELAARAKERQERVATILANAQAATQQAQQDRQQRENEFNQSTNELNQANAAKRQADQAQATTTAAMKQAEATLKQKQEQSAAAPNDENLKQQLAQAQQQFDTAKTAADAAIVAATEAGKVVEAATAKRTAAEEARAAAQMALQAAQQFQQRAQQEKQRADQYANQKQNEANPRGFNVNVPSNSITIKLVEYPMKVESMTESLTINQGEKAEVVVRVSRQYEFTGNINVQTQLPGGVGGISIPGANVPENQPEAKYEITVQPNATVGEHSCTVRLQMNFNGQNLVMERPLKLTIVEVKKE